VGLPEKLVFTWKWEQPDGNGPDLSADSREMVVTVELRDMGGSTEVVVTHEYHPGTHIKI
ncbi:MAG: SRPBCC domain-containing protein, partial [Chloroflexi bacterium]|nr:SRPBCC domain-containing protein [Chloroflexota bacterium]